MFDKHEGRCQCRLERLGEAARNFAAVDRDILPDKEYVSRLMETTGRMLSVCHQLLECEPEMDDNEERRDVQAQCAVLKLQIKDRRSGSSAWGAGVLFPCLTVIDRALDAVAVCYAPRQAPDERLGAEIMDFLRRVMEGPVPAGA